MDNKLKCLCLLAIVLAIIGIEFPIDTDTNAGTQWVVNNTNLAPTVPGEHIGTGERVGNNTTYWNNNTPIEIFLYSHANTSGTAAEIHLFINGTKVSDTSGRALGIAEQSNRSIVATIPQYSFYSVEMVNYHHYEWYEYKILTGNVTISQFNITNHSLLSNLQGGVPAQDEFFHLNKSHYDAIEALVDCTSFATPEQDSAITFNGLDFLCVYINKTDNTKVNKSGDVMTGTLNMSNNNITNVFELNNVLRLNTTHRAAYTNKVDTYLYPNYTEITGMKSNDDLYDHLFTSANANTQHNLISFVDVNTSGWNYFQAKAANGVYYSNNNTALPTNLTTDKTMFRLASAGYDGNTWSGSKAIIDFVSSGNWNTSFTPARIDFWTTQTTSVTLRMSIFANGSVKINGLSGAGNAYVCTDTTGTLYRGSPGC